MTAIGNQIPGRRLVQAACCGIGLALLSGVHAAYDEPDFDEAVFNVDALSLEERDRDQIASTLAALAVNFSDDPLVDDDLREKALAIALRLDPLNGSARLAHSTLSRSNAVEKVDYLTNLNSIASALWRYAEKLAAPDAEPEDGKLASYLMEIALVVEKNPPADRILVYGRTAKQNPPEWSRVVQLQGSAYESNRRASRLLQEAASLATRRPPPNGMNGNPPPPRPPVNNGKGNAPPRPPQPPADDSRISPIKLDKVSLRFVGAAGESGAVPGEAHLNVREPGEDERSLFGLFLGGEKGMRRDFEMRLSWDRDGPTIGGLDSAEDRIRPAYPHWPKNRIADFTFAAAGDSQPDRVDLSLSAPILLEAAFSGVEISPGVALAGMVNDEGEIVLPAPAPAVTKAASAGGTASGVRALLIPASATQSLQDAVTAGDLSVLVRPQVIAFKDYTEARKLLLEKTPDALLEAMAQFDEVQNLQGMSLDEIAKYATVQERLEKVIELWPGHLSAQMMLAYGKAPVDMHLSIKGSLGQFDAALKPVAKYYTDSTFGGAAIIGEGDKLVDHARTSLRELRTKVTPDARNCLTLAEKAVEAFDEYFSLSNKGSSRAAQLRRELQEAINALNAERVQLGATENISL